ncbi:DUF3016 domain-containing protein [Alteromonadaceae bacterium BrNp21-10]|nr:DUF3016 domain-containing protein [Alteromonadaceae bacterium BrNp21-10]
MKKLALSSLLLSMLLTLLPNIANAQADLEVVWEKPTEYHDVRPTSSTRTKFRAHVFSELEEYMRDKLMVRLADGQKFKMTVTDLDLAGQVWPGMMVGLNSSGDVRLVKQIDIPRIEFSYQYLDVDGSVIKEGQENIKDMTFMDRASRISSSQNFRYEKAMIREWFNDHFKSYFIEKNSD